MREGVKAGDMAEWVDHCVQRAIRKPLKGLIEESGHPIYTLKDGYVIYVMHRRRKCWKKEIK